MIVWDGVGHGIPKDTIVVNHLKWLKKHLVTIYDNGEWKQVSWGK